LRQSRYFAVEGLFAVILFQKKRAPFSSKPSTIVQWLDGLASLLDAFGAAASEQLLEGLSQISSGKC